MKSFDQESFKNLQGADLAVLFAEIFGKVTMRAAIDLYVSVVGDAASRTSCPNRVGKSAIVEGCIQNLAPIRNRRLDLHGENNKTDRNNTTI